MVPRTMAATKKYQFLLLTTQSVANPNLQTSPKRQIKILKIDFSHANVLRRTLSAQRSKHIQLVRCAQQIARDHRSSRHGLLLLVFEQSSKKVLSRLTTGTAVTGTRIILRLNLNKGPRLKLK